MKKKLEMLLVQNAVLLLCLSDQRKRAPTEIIEQWNIVGAQNKDYVGRATF